MKAKDKICCVHTTNKAGLTYLFWCVKPDPQNRPQQQNPANPCSEASHLWFISYFHLIGGCLGVIRLWQSALCCGCAVYISLLETCWHWGELSPRTEPLSRSGQYLDLSWPIVGKDRSTSAQNGKQVGQRTGRMMKLQWSGIYDKVLKEESTLIYHCALYIFDHFEVFLHIDEFDYRKQMENATLINSHAGKMPSKTDRSINYLYPQKIRMPPPLSVLNQKSSSLAIFCMF